MTQVSICGLKKPKDPEAFVEAIAELIDVMVHTMVDAHESVSHGLCQGVNHDNDLWERKNELKKQITKMLESA